MDERKKISILGCGWLGMPLGAAFVQNGYEVKGSSRTNEKQEEIASNGMIPFEIDLGKMNNLPSDFFDADIMIFNIPPSNAENESVYLNQLDGFIKCVRPTTKILFVSSTGVYPDLNREVEEKDASIDSKSRSGISLLRGEGKFWSDQNTVVRFGGLIDRRRHPGKWFAGRSGLKGGNIPINLIHLDDCIGGIIKIVENDLWGEVFNICDPRHPRKSEYYPKLTEQMGLEPPSYSRTDNESWKIVKSGYFVKKSGYEFRGDIWNP